jgi:hypothetical protein
MNNIVESIYSKHRNIEDIEHANVLLNKDEE